MDPFDAVIRELRAAATQPVLPSLPQQKHRRGRKRIAIAALATVVLFAGVSPVFTRRASSPTPDLTAPAWTAIMQRIDARRMAAFMHADPTRLLDADIRASAAYVSDLRSCRNCIDVRSSWVAIRSECYRHVLFRLRETGAWSPCTCWWSTRCVRPNSLIRPAR